MIYSNGFVIQHLGQPYRSIEFITHFTYRGISAFNTYPLSGDSRYRRLTDEMMTREFITDMDLLARCMAACRECGIPVRILFAESDYNGEVWQGPEIQGSLLGYEYNTIPFDDQIITDLQWYEPLSRFRGLLNTDGLFPSLGTACRFKTASVTGKWMLPFSVFPKSAQTPYSAM